MLVGQRIWRIGQLPQQLRESTLASEQLLEEMIVAAPEAPRVPKWRANVDRLKSAYDAA
jgi:hypothetical protein